MSVVTFASLKGGVGKTSLAINVAHAFAQSGSNTLLIDLDPTAHATGIFRMHANPETFPRYAPLAWAFLRKLEEGAQLGSDPFVVAVRPNLELVPGGEEMRHFIPAHGARHFIGRFPGFIREMQAHFDRIVIDTAPDLHILTRMAVACADLAVMPIDAGAMGIAGAASLLRSLSNLKRPRWAVARTMVHATAARTQVLRESRLQASLSIVPSGVDLGAALEAQAQVPKFDLPVFLLNSQVQRVEHQNQLSFMGKTAFDACARSLPLARQYGAVAQEIERILGASLGQPLSTISVAKQPSPEIAFSDGRAIAPRQNAEESLPG